MFGPFLTYYFENKSPLLLVVGNTVDLSDLRCMYSFQGMDPIDIVVPLSLNQEP